MHRLRALGALVGAGLLTFATVGAVGAVPAPPHLTVTKTADPENVPVGGASVTFTIHVYNDGKGAFHQIAVSDDMVGCTPAGPVADAGSDGLLSELETWEFTCTVANVLPDTTNTASVVGCTDSSGSCNADSHDASGQGQVTVGLCESNCDSGPGDSGNGGGNDATDIPPTDTAFTTAGTSGPSDAMWLFVIGLGVLLGSVVVLKPARVGRHR